MDHDEFRILCSCVRFLYPLNRVLRDPEIGAPEPTHAARLVRRLHQEGDLRFFRPEGLEERIGSDGVDDLSRLVAATPRTEEIESGMISATPDLVFGFTSKGALRWEEAAKPNWDLYINEAASGFDEHQDTWQTDLWSRTRVRLEAAIRFRYAGERAPGPEEWELVRPWHATYWKVLPEGFHVRLRTGRVVSFLEWTEDEVRWSNTLSWYESPSESC
jgi:hypothetical protein